MDHAPAVLGTASGKQAGNAGKALGKKIITRGSEREKLMEMEKGIREFYCRKARSKRVERGKNCALTQMVEKSGNPSIESF